MRQVTKKGLITVAAAGGVLALSAGSAFADSTAEGAAVGSPGVLSGNAAQAPVHVPVNACGNTVDIIGLLNPAFGNQCTNVSAPKPRPRPEKPQPEPEKPEVPRTPEKPSPEPEPPEPVAPPQKAAPPPAPKAQTVTDSSVRTELAETGGQDLGLGLSVGAGLLIGGTVLYRRARVGARKG